jgi:hypothetical protein
MDPHRPTTQHRGLVIAAFPKSASSHLVALIAKAVPKSRVVRAKTCKGFGHNLLDPERIPVEPASHVVAYGHMPACGHNIDAILTKMVRPSCVLAIRSLPDVVVSFADHIHRDRRAPIDFDTPGLVDGFLGTMDLSRSELYDLIIDYSLPWYIRFLCSWLHGRHGIPLTVSTFEEHTAHPAAALGHLVAFAGLESDPTIVRSFADERHVDRVNFNRGVTGRGMSELSFRQIDRVAELAHGVKGLRGTRLGRYLAGGYPAVACSPHDVLDQKMTGGTTREWFLEDQPSTDTSESLNAAHLCRAREASFSHVEPLA